MDIPCVLEFYAFMLPLLIVAIESGSPTQPVLEKSEIHINITAGRTAILPCMVTGITDSNKNRYKVVWQNPQRRTLTYGTQRIISDKRFSVTALYDREWNLHIRTVEPSDHGEYRCQLNTQPVQQKKVFLHVQVPPDISPSPDTAVPEGDTLTLQCNVTGRPPPAVTWSKDGIVIQRNSEILEIDSISRNQAGIYRCGAVNGINPRAMANIVVDVLYGPEVTSLTSRLGQYRGKQTILECRVRANPYKDSFWSRNGEKLPDLPWKYKTEVFNDGGTQIMQLRILMLEKRDFGRYYCRAKNKLGSDSDVAILAELMTEAPTTSTTTSTVTMSLSSSPSPVTMTTTIPQSSSSQSTQQTSSGKTSATDNYSKTTHKYSENSEKYGSSSSSSGDGNVIEVKGKQTDPGNTGTVLQKLNFYTYTVFISIPLFRRYLFNT